MYNVLVTVDPSIPAIRGQRAFSKLKKELDDIHALIRMKNLIDSETNLYKEYLEYINLRIKKYSDQFSEKSHELLTNTLHVTEQQIVKHIQVIRDERLIVGMGAYVRKILAEIKELKLPTEYTGIGFLIRELLAILDMIHYIYGDAGNMESKRIYTLSREIIESIKLIHTLDLIINTFTDKSNISPSDLKPYEQKFAEALAQLLTEYEHWLNVQEDLSDNIVRVLNYEISGPSGTFHKSISARNLIHLFR